MQSGALNMAHGPLFPPSAPRAWRLRRRSPAARSIAAPIAGPAPPTRTPSIDNRVGLVDLAVVPQRKATTFSDSPNATKRGSLSIRLTNHCEIGCERRATAESRRSLNARSAISIDECQKMTPYQGMPDVAPHRLHISRHYGSTLYRTPRTEDGRHVMAGLLAHGSSALLRPSQRAQRGTVSGIAE